MNRFYCDIRDGDQLITDKEGMEFTDLAAAKDYAMGAARELLADKLRRGEVIDGQKFDIRDEDGQHLAVILLKDVLRLP